MSNYNIYNEHYNIGGKNLNGCTIKNLAKHVEVG